MATTSAKGASVTSSETVWRSVQFEDGTGQDFATPQDLDNYIELVLGNIPDLAKAAFLSTWKANDPLLNNEEYFVGKTCTIDPANIGKITTD